ncbi:MAG: hypothetical protein QXH02_00510 [Desulfurococcaceae archaeon]
MRINLAKWKSRKEYMWRRIWEDLEIGYLDRDLLPLLVLVNTDSELYTTSSCSGRIVVMDSDYPWSRDETGIVFKAHIPVKPEELVFVYRFEPHKRIWINVTGPIVHIYSSTMKKATQILEVARKSGFKHSGIMHLSKARGVFLELVTGIFVSQLVRTRDRVFIKYEDLEAFIKLLNAALLEGKKRLQRLYEGFLKVLPEEVDEAVKKDLDAHQLLAGKTPIEIFHEMCKEGGAECM